MSIGRKIGENLRKIIKKRGYRSVELFAYENAIDKSALSKILRGDRLPRVDTFIRIAEALEVTLNELYPLPQPKPFQTKAKKK